MADFFEQYLIKPILEHTGYNPYNTLILGIGLVIGAVLVYFLMKKMKVEINSNFAAAVIPFILFGSIMRVLNDAAIKGALSTPMLNTLFSSYIFVTPGPYFITAALAIVTLLFTLFYEKLTGYSYWRPMAVLGMAYTVIVIYLLPPVQFMPLMQILAFWAVWTAAFWLAGRSYILTERFRKVKNLLSPVNMAILSAHFLDASVTFVSLSYYGYVEQHVIPNIFIGMFGPFVMFILKAAVVLPVLWAFDKAGEDPNARDLTNFLKIVVLILGLAPGLRDLVRLMAMV